MMNYLHDVTRARQRMTALLNEAHNERLLPPQPGITDHLLATIGTWMMSSGERLMRLSALHTHDKKLQVIETTNR